MLYLVSLPNRLDVAISPSRLLFALLIACGCSIGASLLIGYLRFKLPTLLARTTHSESQTMSAENQNLRGVNFAAETRRPA